MLFTVFDTRSHAYCGTFGANEFFWFELLKLVLLVLLFTVLHTSEVGRLALEAQIVGTLVNCKLL